MNSRFIEITVGAFLIVGLLAFIMLALKVSGFTLDDSRATYSIIASFDNVGDLKLRAPITVSGVKVGQVSDINLDKTTYKAVVTMKINHQETLPADTSASILTQGLLGSNYISLTPGFDTNYLKNGDKIENTHPAIILENLIGQLIFNLKEGKK